MLSTLEEDIKPIVPSLIYIPVHLLGNEFICVLCIFKFQVRRCWVEIAPSTDVSNILIIFFYLPKHLPFVSM